MSIAQVLQRDINTRGEGAGGGRFARHFLERAGDRELRIADLDRVAYIRVKLQEEAFLDDGALPFAKIPGSGRWSSLQRTIKRKLAAESAHTGKPGSIALGE